MIADFTLWTGLAAALVYFAMAEDAPSWPRSVTKTLPVALFALAAFLAGGPAFLVAGLVLSALGDFALSRTGRAAFLYGLSAFALAHLVYALLFLSLSGAALWEGFAATPLLALFLAFVVLSTEIWLVPHVAGLAWPVRLYALTIGAMGLAALSLPPGPVTLGAAAFIASDMVLGYRMFRISADHPLSGVLGWLVWGLYVLAQALILAGAVA